MKYHVVVAVDCHAIVEVEADSFSDAKARAEAELCDRLICDEDYSTLNVDSWYAISAVDEARKMTIYKEEDYE